MGFGFPDFRHRCRLVAAVAFSADTPALWASRISFDQVLSYLEQHFNGLRVQIYKFICNDALSLPLK